jgi:monoamine oxidase
MTLDEFRDHLAENLGIKGDGNALSADRANYLETLITNCQAELEQKEVALWPSSDIPAYAVESFVDYCKASVSRFGMDRDPVLKELALMELRSLTADPRHGTGKACYF